MAKIHQAIQKKEKEISRETLLPARETDWCLKDLQNGKQKSDLEKKLTLYLQKNGSSVFNFTGSRPKEGVSTIVGNLANHISVRKANKRVLVVDANFSNPVLHGGYGIHGEPGLFELLSCGLEDVSAGVHGTGMKNVDIIPCGRLPESAGEGIEQEKFSHIISSVKEDYDYILIDSSPLLFSSDALSSALASDVTFLVLQSFRIHREVAERAKLLLLDNDCVIGGVVLNLVKQVIPNWIYRII